MKFKEFVKYFTVERKVGNEYLVHCPAHDDKKASLAITEKNGTIFLFCHKGCDYKEILNKLNIPESELFTNNKEDYKMNNKNNIEYIYTDSKGNPVHKTIRYPNKNFSQFMFQNNEWIPTIKGCKLYPFNLPKVIESDTIYWVEGEKDANTLTEMGLTSTTTCCGANNFNKNKEEYIPYFKNKIVYIIPDNDEAGNSYAKTISESLKGIAKKVKILQLSNEVDDLQEKEDISDVYQRLGKEKTLEILEKLKMQTGKLKLKTAFELQNTVLPPLKVIVENILFQGLTILASPPKYGKSWLVLDLCLSVCRGDKFLNHNTNKGKCLYLALEDSDRRLQQRINKLLNNSSAPDNFIYSISSSTIETGLIDEIEEFISQNKDIALIVIDTLQKVRDITSSNSHYANDYKDVSALKRIADKNNIAIILVHHTRKPLGKDNNDVFNEINGTNGLSGASDSSICLTRERRFSKESILSITGRDVEQTEKLIAFDKKQCRWQYIGDLEEIEEKRIFDEYSENPIVNTIKKLLEEAENNKVELTLSDIKQKVQEIQGYQLEESDKKISKTIREMKDLYYKYDKILYTPPAKNGGTKGRLHTFKKEEVS